MGKKLRILKENTLEILTLVAAVGSLICYGVDGYHKIRYEIYHEVQNHESGYRSENKNPPYLPNLRIIK